MRLIVTRPADDAVRLEARLLVLGHEAIVSPVMTIAMRAPQAIAATGVQAVALSSANAARAVARHPAFAQLRDLPCFTVGEQSARAAEMAGFHHVVAGAGDITQLAETIAAKCQPARGAVLYLSGAQTAGDLAGALAARGLTAERVVLYDAVPAEALSAAAAAALRDGTAEGVLLYSPRSARLWSSCVAAGGLTHEAQLLRHYCLSQNVAAALGKDYLTIVAAQPNEEALLRLLDPGR
jgi:uroporphyrinogen-III synthase